MKNLLLILAFTLSVAEATANPYEDELASSLSGDPAEPRDIKGSYVVLGNGALLDVEAVVEVPGHKKMRTMVLVANGEELTTITPATFTRLTGMRADSSSSTIEGSWVMKPLLDEWDIGVGLKDSDAVYQGVILESKSLAIGSTWYGVLTILGPDDLSYDTTISELKKRGITPIVLRS